MPISYRAAQNLIKRKDEPGLRAALEDRLDPNLSNENGWTLLMLAAVEGAASLGKLLLDHGADLARKNAKGQTAREIAEARSALDFMTLLDSKSAG